MDDQLYREIILEHWKNPQNSGVLANADIDIADYNPLCGDEIRITAKLAPRSVILSAAKNLPTQLANEAGRSFTPLRSTQDDNIPDQDLILSEINFVGRGCAISQASASLFTEYIKSKTVTEVKNLDQQSALDLLEVELTSARLKCALLPYSALQKGLTGVSSTTYNQTEHEN